jgi:hypothetical protein
MYGIPSVDGGYVTSAEIREVLVALYNFVLRIYIGRHMSQNK